MKQGKSLVQMAQELEAMRAAAKDFVVPVEKLVMQVERVQGVKVPVIGFQNGKSHQYRPTNWAHSQIATYTDIPKGYYDRISNENAELLAWNVNHGLARATEIAKQEKRQESRMVRTVNDTARAVLSSRYRILDCHDLADTVLPTMIQEGLQVVASELTERRFFIKALSPKLTTEIKKGDMVQYGLVISSSDVGSGSVRVEPLIYRLVCANGMIANTAIKKFHVGKNQAEEDIRELLTDDTKHLTDAAFWAQVNDVVKGSMNPRVFEAQVDRLRVAANEEIKNFDLPRVVELTMKATGITGEGKKNSILAALASGNEGAGLTRWGLINSFTRAAQDEGVNFEESIEMERAAGQILELPKAAWSHIAAVA